MSRLRVGVAGLGAVAQSVHLPLLQRRWDLFEIAAVCDLSPTLLGDIGDQLGIEPAHRHATPEALLDDPDVDALVLLTSGGHGALALRALGRGVPVLCEKPLAVTLREADELRAAEERAGRPMLLLGYMKEYDAAVAAASQALAGTDVVWAEVEVLHPDSPAQLAFAHLRPPPSDVPSDVLAALRAADDALVREALGDAAGTLGPAYAGIVLGSLVHDVAVLRHLFGPLTTVTSASRWSHGTGPGSLVVSAETAAGARVLLHWHFLADYPAYHETIRVHHGAGSVQLHFPVPYLLNAPTELTVVTADGVAERAETRREVTEAFEHELVAFHAMVEAGVRPPTGVAEGRADIETAQRIALALARAEGVTVGGEAARLA